MEEIIYNKSVIKWIFLFILPLNLYANCIDYYFSLDFGGRIGDGLEISDYLVKEKVPHVIFMVGYNLNTQQAKELCHKINTNPEYRKYIKVGNHTKSHKGFIKTDKYPYLYDEIMGNEALILEKCTTQNFVKVFRYPKGQPHPIAEKILEDNNYSSKFSQYSEEQFKTKMGVGWTSDTRDWIEEGAASIWAQNYYYNKHHQFMPVSQNSAEEFKNYVMAQSEDSPAKKAFLKGGMPETFTKDKHQEIDGWHGPSKEAIISRVLEDKGVNGKCIPLTHFGGFNTLEAFKTIIPSLKKQKKKFKFLDDNLDYAVKDLHLILEPEKLDPIDGVKSKECSLPDDPALFHIVSQGETLFGIARKYNISVEEIKKINNLKTDEIDIDQKLRLSYQKILYSVQKGDTLFKIAKTFDISVDELKKWNHLDSNEIDIDQKLTILR